MVGLLTGGATPVQAHIWNVPGATGANIAQATAVAWDHVNPSIIIADTGWHQVVRIGIDGTASIVAGTGQAGFNGDQAEALAAHLHTPQGVAVAANGDIIVADTSNNRVRRINPGQYIITLAGTGVSGDNGDQHDATAGQLAGPSGVAVTREDEVLIADRGNNRVRKVTTDGRLVTIAGTGARGYSGDDGAAEAAELDRPIAVAVAPNGDIIIADGGNHCIRRIREGVMTTLATDFRRVTDVAVNRSGRILVADAGAGIVYALSPANELTPLAGGGPQRVENGLPGRSASLRTLIALAATPGEGVLAVRDETDGTSRCVFIGPGSDGRLVTDVRAATRRGGNQARQRSRDVLQSLRSWRDFPPPDDQLAAFAAPNSRLSRLPTVLLREIDKYRPDPNERAILALRAQMAFDAFHEWDRSVSIFTRILEKLTF
jgi:hypothetical protein